MVIILIIVASRELEYTKETLIKFRDDKEKREKAEKDAAAGVGEGFGGFGGFGGGGEETKNEEEDVCIIYILYTSI